MAMNRSGEHGHYTSDDGQSRPLDPTGDLRTVIATTLAQRDGWAEIRPSHWRDAAAVAQALKQAGWIRTARERRTAQQRREDADA